MHTLSATALLGVWERGLNQNMVRRALLLLSLLHSDAQPAGLAALPLSKRDAQLMILREWLFGSQIHGVANCPRCSERLEMAFDLHDLRRTALASDTDPVAVPTANGEVMCRLPTSADVLALEAVRDAIEARRQLAMRCIVPTPVRNDGAVRPDGPTTSSGYSESSSDALIDAIATHLQRAHAEADPQLSLHCPACANVWELSFDITAFLWMETNDWAVRLLRDVHTLARAYSWREQDILAMSAHRRSMYLQLIGA